MPASSSAQPLYDHKRPPRRPAPDWGGDDLFDAVPRRRFARAGEDAVAPDAAPEPAPAVDVDREAAALAPARRLRVVEEEELVASAPPARRTVTITGHPGRSASLQRPRASGGRSLEQRLHARPDRLAAWAFALGLLLVAVALATSG